MSLATDGKTMSLALESSPNLSLITIDSVEETVGFSFNMVGFDLSVPLEFFVDDDDEENPVTDDQRSKMKSLELHAAAIAGAFEFDMKSSK